MKRQGIIVLSFLAALHLMGQNLVKNCDFSKVTQCPVATGQFDRAFAWHTPGQGTSDLCHSCSGGAVSAPYNMWGFEIPFSGEGYAHIISYYPLQGNDYREYIQSKLACPLEAGETYDVSFYVSVSDNSRYAIDGMGLYFSRDPITQNGDNVINLGIPGHVYHPPGLVIDQKEGWRRISGQYTAEGGEEYITIGNFIPNAALTLVTYPGSTVTYSSFYIDMVNVSPVDTWQLLANDTVICHGEALFLLVTAPCSGTITWDNGSNDPFRLITAPGNYYLTWEIGCSSLYEQISVSWLPPPEINLPGESFICPGGTVLLEPGPFQSYLWSDGSDGPVLVADQPGIYWVELRDDIGCLYRDSVWITAIEVPGVDLGEDRMPCIGEILVLDAGFGDDYTIYTWQDQSSERTLEVSNSGTYSVTAINPCGSGHDVVTVTYRNCAPMVAVPNAFSPDGDGLNDVFRAVGANVTNLRLQVYNRWGQMIFSCKGGGDGWDGTVNGVPCPGDVYVWVLRYDSESLDTPVSETLKGTVVLIR